MREPCYARVSKSDDSQDTAAQVSALKSAGCKRVFEDKASGGRWDRPELHRMLDQLPGQTHEISVAGPSLMNDDVPSRWRGEDYVTRRPGSASRCSWGSALPRQNRPTP